MCHGLNEERINMIADKTKKSLSENKLRHSSVPSMYAARVWFVYRFCRNFDAVIFRGKNYSDKSRQHIMWHPKENIHKSFAKEVKLDRLVGWLAGCLLALPCHTNKRKERHFRSGKRVFVLVSIKFHFYH